MGVKAGSALSHSCRQRPDLPFVRGKSEREPRAVSADHATVTMRTELPRYCSIGGESQGKRNMSLFVRKFSAAAFAGSLSLWIGASGALAQGVPPGCVASGDPNGAVAGAVIGGVAGALIGNAASGSRQKAQGTVLGGLGGAVAGAVIGGNVGQSPCPQGYVYRSAPPPPPVVSAYDEPPPPPAQEGEFWYGAPPRIHDRILFLRRRVENMDRDGFLSPRERDHLFHRLGDIEHREEDVRRRNDGHLPPEVRDHLEADLNDVARHVRWEEYRSEHAEQQ
jgi:hypothetical protein